MLLLQFIFWFLIVLIAHSYLFYPLWMKKRAQKQENTHQPNTYFPSVSVLIAAYNEEQIIVEKLNSTLNTTYPAEKLSIWVGSDKSSDGTDDIVRKFAKKFPNVHLVRFEERMGKPQIINHLVENCQTDVLILTDADTLFLSDTIPNLVKPFEDEEIGGVQAYFRSKTEEKVDVAKQELSYNLRELQIKIGQSKSGCVIGAYGACYAIRKSLYHPVPLGFSVDDFYIFMKILELGKKTVVAQNAICHLEISGKGKEEFARKVRIGKGNYQNLYALTAFWNPFKNKASYYYWSHKVLRWLTPFFLMLVFFSNLILALEHPFYFRIFLLQVSVYLLATLDLFLKSKNIHFGFLRFASHFMLMNIALFIGFLRFIKADKNSIWKH